MSERIDYTQVSPNGMKALGGVYSYISQCGLDHALIELVFLRVSQINGCAYCLDMHTRALLNAGLPVEKITLTLVWREAKSWFTPRERAALAWSEALTLIAQQNVSDETFAAMQQQFSDKEIIDLNIAIGLMNAYNRMAISMGKLPESLSRATSSN